MNSADISGDFLTKLPKTEVKIPNPTFRIFIIGRKALNSCGNLDAKKHKHRNDKCNFAAIYLK